jgi:ketosteroid isomerase-like protein
MTARDQREAEVRAVIETWIDAVRRNDLSGILANHDEGVVFYDVPEPPVISGIDAYRVSWEEFLGYLTLRGEFQFEELEVRAGDDVAFAFGVIRCRGGTEENWFPVRLSMGLVRQGGRWSILHEHHSVPAT